MKCPVCSVDLRMTDRQGVEIDYCPQCRGVWLDRGELDKIIEQSDALVVGCPDEDDRRGRYRRGDQGQGEPYERRESFWSELFDFF